LGLAVWIILTWLEPGGVFTVILILLAVIAIATWPLTMSATGTLTQLQFAIPEIEEVDPQELAELAEELEAMDDTQPAEQLQALQQKRESLVKVLERRLDAGELTYARYLSTAQQVYTSALDNLGEVAVAYQSISTIDEDYIDRRLGELALDDAHAESTEKEQASLERRRELRRNQQRKIAQLMAQNEAALTALDRTTTALADAPIGKKPEDAEAAMEALKELADRAGKYAER
jgi:biopolymer transport protein ExbB/TolQ